MQTSGDRRREIAKSYLRRMGRAKRNPSMPAFMGDGFRFALPILRNSPNRWLAMTWIERSALNTRMHGHHNHDRTNAAASRISRTHFTPHVAALLSK